MFGIGAGELVLILIAGLIIFGPGELPKIGRAVGKGLREFRKAQAAFTATLDEVSAEPEKKVSIEKKSDTEKNSSEPKVTSAVQEKVAEVQEEKISAVKNISADETPPHSALTVDDVINLAKNNPISKENLDEKNFTDTAGNSSPAGASASNVAARSDSNSTGKQS